MVQRGLDERAEERMGLPRARAEFRVELPGHEPWVIGQLDDLHELLVGPDARDPEAALLERVEVVVVDLVAMAVPLPDGALPVGLGSGAALAEHDGVEPEAHGAALVLDGPLLGQEVDHVVARRGVELRRVGVREAGDMPRELDDGALHPQADAEVRHASLPGVTDGLDLPFDAAVPETAGHEDAVEPRHVALEPLPLD